MTPKEQRGVGGVWGMMGWFCGCGGGVIVTRTYTRAKAQNYVPKVSH